MKKLFPLVIMLLVLAACNPGHQTDSSGTAEVNTAGLKSEIDALTAYFKEQSNKSLNKQKANELVEKSKQFVAAFPDDPIGGAYLFRAGEVARALGQYEEAVQIMDKVYTDYSNHEKAPPALFLKGFTYEENLNDIPTAKKCYNEFLAKYPDHKLAAQIKQLLQVIDTSPEDLIKQFQQKEK